MDTTSEELQSYIEEFGIVKQKIFEDGAGLLTGNLETDLATIAVMCDMIYVSLRVTEAAHQEQEHITAMPNWRIEDDSDSN